MTGWGWLGWDDPIIVSMTTSRGVMGMLVDRWQAAPVMLPGSHPNTCIHLNIGDRPDGGREGGGEEVLRVGLPDQAPAHAVSYI